jgi:hypothetical protein
MKKFIIYTALFFSTIVANAQISFYPQTGFVFYNTNTFSVNQYTPFTMPYTLPNRLEGYAQLNDSSCPNTPIIFSTDGIDVYHGGTGAIVASGLLGQQTSTNAATILPVAGNKALIITTKAFSDANNEAYSSLLNYTGSCGGYTFTMPAATKNLQLIGGTVTSFSEKVTVIRKASGNDYWLLMHEATNAGAGSNQYLVFSISYATGVISFSASYNVGLPVKKIGGKGQMQAITAQVPGVTSAYFVGAAHFIRPGSLGGATDVLIMNTLTGALTFKETMLHGFLRPYGLEFSRAGSSLYVAFRNVAKTIFRYDPYVAPGSIFTTMTPSAYGASIPNFRFGQLQRTDNDAIYTALFTTNKLLYIPTSSSLASFPLAPPSLTTSAPAGTVFRFGLPNYWRN